MLDRVLLRSLSRGCEKVGFRVTEYSVQGNHVHLIVEGSDRDRIARGLQELCVRIARGLNRLWNRKGTVFCAAETVLQGSFLGSVGELDGSVGELDGSVGELDGSVGELDLEFGGSRFTDEAFLLRARVSQTETSSAPALASAAKSAPAPGE